MELWGTGLEGVNAGLPTVAVNADTSSRNPQAFYLVTLKVWTWQQIYV